MTALAKNARVAGFLYIAASVFGVVRLLYIPSALIVHGNPAATASKIAGHESLFRWGILSYLLGGVLWLFVPLALYCLLKEVDHGLAVLMVILGSLMQTPIFVVNTANDVAALLLIRGDTFLSAFDKPQRDALAMLFLGLHSYLGVASLIFAGLWLFPFGVLVYKSRFLPRLLGIWLLLACFAWLVVASIGLLLPDYQNKAFTMSQPFTLGEVATMLWLVILVARHKSQTAAA